MKLECACCRGLMVRGEAFDGFERFHCERCGYERFLDELKKPSALLYETDSDYTSDLAISDDPRDLLQWNHLQASKFIESAFPSRNARVLDVGCFNGFFVRYLRDRGFLASGVDFNQSAIDFGVRKYDLLGAISTSNLETLSARGESYDVITFLEVIEHLDDFLPVLILARRLLNSRGVLVISVPNKEMTWRPPLDFPPHHMSRFSPLSLRVLADRLDLQVVAQVEQASLFDFIRHYIGLLFRSRQASLRGGSFRAPSFANSLRRLANRNRKAIAALFRPLDILLRLTGFRYIGLVTIFRAD